MAVRKAGKRLLLPLQKKRRKTMPPGRRRSGTTEKEQTQIAQLVVSGTVFVLLVVVKLFLPGQMAVIGAPLAQMLEKNMDVTAVFSTVGRAFSGGEAAEDSLNHVYQAVFGPENTDEDLSGGSEQNAVDEFGGKESDLLSGGTPILYSEENIPERVQLQQVVLGFDYCTPLEGNITSFFGYRKNPTEGEDRFHYGLDMTSDEHTDIVSFADGVVTVVGDSSSYGKYLIVSHENGCTTLYAHCEKINVQSGQTVKKGDRIAQMGDSGQTTGPHLHFELQKDGVYLNPVYYVY